MRPALRLLAVASKPASKFLEPGAPTGITGLFTHAAPRSTLLYLYSSTLEKLQTLPESSVYRQSAEALTRHRMSIIERVKPAGLAEWQTRVAQTVDAHPEAFRKIPITTQSGEKEYNVVWKPSAQEGAKTAPEWDDEAPGKPMMEGPRSEEEQIQQLGRMARDPVEEHRVIPRIEPEPSLTAEQVQEIEGEVGSGLIEEVIQVAEGELELVHKMAEAKVWEDLEEKPVEGQWTYFERDTHTGTTQAS
ncbi:hypothetical protein KC353_g16279 [Hortaea werneckii]|uniref:Uncharacterized protein n=1 Tax=Hortaea werneckii TaxID=91943 RepID=A0A3M7D6B1_HORWE|nr:hypothetical protein KC349_g3659 [Hortaea werneckii]KAI7699760.1 hypothetical protein KC353_g16279 [Hortaea werneckii]RMY59396.1 hypothetical protein D0865_02089 [Hortaea werneckii]